MLAFGVGINDADYTVKPTVNGKRVVCPYYRAWMNMLKRCYSKEFHDERPTYIGCNVVVEWLSFMGFRSWMMVQDWEGMHLDKDIVIEGNKTYGPNTCAFIDRRTNALLNERAAARGEFPIGVTAQGSRYQARCRTSVKEQYIGLYKTPEDAHMAYLRLKSSVVMEVALRQPDIRVKSALFLRSLSMAYRAENKQPQY